MFWRFGGYANLSTIDTLLDKPDLTLEELLDEPETIQELKQLNTKLIEYLREDHALKRLMEYVTAPSLVNDDEDDAKDTSEKGKDDAASAEQTDMDEEKEGDLRDILDPDDLDKVEKKRLTHAYIACEILSSETWSILESMMANPAYLGEFWGFLRRPPPLDSLQASYFTKVNETLLDKKTDEMLEFLKTLDGIVPALLQHVDNPMVMDLLLKIISLEKAEGGQGTVDWLRSQGLIPNLLSFLSPDRPASVQTSAGDFLKAIITISANASPNDQSCIGPNSLTRQLVSTECVQQLIDAMLKGGNPLTVGVGIVIEVIRKNNSDYDPESLGGPDTMLTTYDPIYLGTLLRLFAKHIPQFMALIQSSQHTIHEGNKLKTVERGKLNSAWGGQIEPLGFDRFKTCELMAELLHCSNMGLLNEPGSDEYVRQRDEERERLIREGGFDTRGFDTHQDEHSGVDTAADFANDSALDSGSPEDAKVTEVPHVGEDDGFEDVGASGDLVSAKADADTTATANSQPTETVSETSPSEITEPEPVSSEETTDKSESSTTPIDPSSPTTGLSDQVSAMNLESEPQDEQQEPGKDNQEPVASLSQDVPAPLFSKEQASESDSAPADQSEEPSSLIEQVEETSVPNDGGDEDSAEQYIQLDTDGRPVVGDYLKIQFVENKVVPTILGFFFRFPWNNFLHNVVYDVIQQVFNGPMERGYNRALAVDVFDTGRITTAIVEGQKRSDETQRTKQIRLGYMGHLTLVAEEVVKFSERHPPELLSRSVMESVLNPDWIEYVEQTLSETRERDNAILGGVRPDISVGPRQTSLNNTNSGQGFSNSALADVGLNGGIGGSTFQSFDLGQGGVSGGAFGGGGTSLLSGFASSSDDEDEEMEDQDERDSGNADQNDNDNVFTSSASQPIPILPPPPAPLSLGPSRARRQLAARLAAQKQQPSENEGDGDYRGAEGSEDRESDWPDNPFVIAGIDDPADAGSSAFPNSDFGSADGKHSPTFPESGFSPPDSLSTNSSEDEGDGHAESVRRQVRVPLEVEDDDDDEMGEMVGPSGIGMMDSDDEDEAIINESLGYSNLSGPARYNNFRSRAVSSHYDDEQNDSSDGEDDGLVEIMVPGRKASTSN